MTDVAHTSILGSGSYGYALAAVLAQAHPNTQISMYGRNKETIEHLLHKNNHPVFHSAYSLPENVVPTTTADDLRTARLVIAALPAQNMRQCMENLQHYLKPRVILSGAKALEQNSHKRMTEVIAHYFPFTNTAAISGGMIAAEFISGRHVHADVASTDENSLEYLSSFFAPTNISVETTSSVAGVEYGGAFKNVIVIGAGIAAEKKDAAEYTNQLTNELKQLATNLGAEHLDELTHSWHGDISASIQGKSRNYQFGLLLGQGHSTSDALGILADQQKHAEGVVTIAVVNDLMKAYNLDLPLLSRLYDAVYSTEPAGIIAH